MEKKYMLTDETMFFCGRTLHRIKAIRDFANVKAGDLGGWIEKEENLSHNGLCWIFENAAVFGDAQIFGDARIYDDAQVYGDARIYDDAQVYGAVRINANALIKSVNDYLSIGPIGSRNDFTTFYKTRDGSIWVSCGCFNDSIENFEKRVKEVHGISIFKDQYMTFIEASKIFFKINKE